MPWWNEDRSGYTFTVALERNEIEVHGHACADLANRHTDDYVRGKRLTISLNEFTEEELVKVFEDVARELRIL